MTLQLCAAKNVLLAMAVMEALWVVARIATSTRSETMTGVVHAGHASDMDQKNVSFRTYGVGTNE